jgi:hypothetical protein
VYLKYYNSICNAVYGSYAGWAVHTPRHSVVVAAACAVLATQARSMLGGDMCSSWDSYARLALGTVRYALARVATHIVVSFSTE